MWTLTSRLGAAGPTATDAPWSAAVARLRDSSPWAFWAVASALYLVAVAAGRALVPAGSPYSLVDLAPGAAALWLSTHLHARRWWRDRTLLGPVGTILLAGPALHAAHGVPPGIALAHGPLTLATAAATVLAWNLVLRRRGANAVDGIWRLLLAGAVGGFVALLGVPGLGGPGLIATIDADPAPWLGWFVRAVAGIVAPVLLGHALTAPRNRVLRRTSVGRLVLLVGAALVAGSVGVVADQRPYLLIPLVVWAASTLTVRGVAAYACLVLIVALRTAAAATGPFAVGSLVDRSLTANIFVLVVVGIAMTLVRAREERAVLLDEVTARSRQAVEQAELLSTMIAAAQDAVLTVDAQGGVILANGAARVLAGQLGTTAQGLLTAEGAEPIARVLATEEAVVTDIAIGAGADRPKRVLAVRAYPMRHLGRSGAVVFLTDVTTERQRAEGLRQFARTVAHDLRNPLTGIRLSSEMAASALDEGDTDEAAAMMAAVAASGDRAARLLRDVADYSLAGDGRLVTEPVYLDDFVTRIARQRAAESGAAPLDVRVDADVCVDIDARLVARVIENLLGNAAKYCAPGVPASVDVVAYDRGDGRAVVLVQDRGIGVPAGQEARIFEAFHRVPDHATAYAGTGLGLAICRQVVERHGGTISADPRRGGGTTFRMTLPLALEVPLRVAV